MTLSVYLMTLGDCPRSIGEKFATTKEPMLIDCSYLQTTKNVNVIYVQLKSNFFNEDYINDVRTFATTLDPEKKVYLLVGIKPNSFISADLITRIIKSPFVHGVLINAFDPSEINSDYKVLA